MLETWYVYIAPQGTSLSNALDEFKRKCMESISDKPKYLLHDGQLYTHKVVEVVSTSYQVQDSQGKVVG